MMSLPSVYKYRSVRNPIDIARGNIDGSLYVRIDGSTPMHIANYPIALTIKTDESSVYPDPKVYPEYEDIDYTSSYTDTSTGLIQETRSTADILLKKSTDYEHPGTIVDSGIQIRYDTTDDITRVFPYYGDLTYDTDLVTIIDAPLSRVKSAVHFTKPKDENNVSELSNTIPLVDREAYLEPINTPMDIPDEAIMDRKTTDFFIGLAVPRGVVLMYHGNDRPNDEWALCDGNTYTKADGTGSMVTPDLRGKFILGTSPSRILSSTGGSTDAVVVAHTHDTKDKGAHSHGTLDGALDGTTEVGGVHSHGTDSKTGSDGSHNHGGTVSSTTSTGSISGGAHAHSFYDDYITSTGSNNQGDGVGTVYKLTSVGLGGAYDTTGSATPSMTLTMNSHNHTISTQAAHQHSIANSASHAHKILKVADHNHGATEYTGVNANVITNPSDPDFTPLVDDTNLPPYYVLTYIIKL